MIKSVGAIRQLLTARWSNLRIYISIGLLLILISVAFSKSTPQQNPSLPTISIKFINTGKSDVSFLNDTIKVTSNLKNCKYNVTGSGIKNTIENVDCGTVSDINFTSIGKHSITVSVWNSSNEVDLTETVRVIEYCDIEDAKLTQNGPIIYIDLSSIFCNSSWTGEFNISTDKNAFIYYDAGPIWDNSVTTKVNYVNLFYNFTKDTTVNIKISDGAESSIFTESIPAFNPSISNTKGCPGDNTDLTVSLGFDPYFYKDSGSKVNMLRITDTLSSIGGDITLMHDENVIKNWKIPNKLDSSGNVKENLYFVFSVGSYLLVKKVNYKFDIYPVIGFMDNSTETKSSLPLDCYDIYGLPVPCSPSYIIKAKMVHSSNVASKNFLVKLVEQKGNYNDTYYTKFTGGDSVSFGFDGSTNEMCKYTLSTDITCSGGICYSQRTHQKISDGKVCATDLDFVTNCTTPTIQKKYKDVSIIPLPIHFNFGINLSNLEVSYTKEPKGGDQLYRLADNVILPNSNDGNVVLTVVRHMYKWKITPFNVLVSVLLKNHFVPMRVGYNQTPSLSFMGKGSACAGNSTCYTEMPFCGDGVCDSLAGETCLTCKKDCGCGPETLGCYGLPNVPQFTDRHGCILRYHQYEENCTFNDECDASKGLTCVFDTTHGRSEIGHCCKPGEIWDPDTPKGFDDANSSIKGTCRVPRGVRITGISIYEAGQCGLTGGPCSYWWFADCGNGRHPNTVIPEYIISVHVKDLHPGDPVAVFFGTTSSYCCINTNHKTDFGGAAIKYITNPPSDFYVNFRMDHKAPYRWSDAEMALVCKHEPMVVGAFIVPNISNTNISKEVKGNLSLIKKYLGGHFSYSVSNDEVCIKTSDGTGVTDYYDDHHNSGEICMPSQSDAYINNHWGNILEDGNGYKSWGDIVLFFNGYNNSYWGDDDNCTKNKDSWEQAGDQVKTEKVLVGYEIPYPNRFVCGGNKVRVAEDWNR